MPSTKILTEQELRSAVPLDQAAVDCVENAFRLLATADVVMPPILSFHIPDHNGEVDVKTAYVPGIDSFAIKMSPGFFDNPKQGLPSVNGVMVLFSAKTGLLEAVHLDNGYLTDVRTAAAGAVAAKWLSREDSRVAGIVGSGIQARLQLEALMLVRRIERAVVWGRDEEKASACARYCADRLGIPVATVDSVGELMQQSDIVVTTTPSQEPIVGADMLRPGQHVTAMGSDAEYKTELAPQIVTAADLFVCDRLGQSKAQGELRPAIAAGLVAADADYPEIGSIIARRTPARTEERQITVCDLTGTGVQDTAIATMALTRAQQRGGGMTIDN